MSPYNGIAQFNGSESTEQQGRSKVLCHYHQCCLVTFFAVEWRAHRCCPRPTHFTRHYNINRGLGVTRNQWSMAPIPQAKTTSTQLEVSTTSCIMGKRILGFFLQIFNNIFRRSFLWFRNFALRTCILFQSNCISSLHVAMLNYCLIKKCSKVMQIHVQTKNCICIWFLHCQIDFFRTPWPF